MYCCVISGASLRELLWWAMFGFSSFLKGGSVVSIVRSLLFTFGLPGAWESSSSGVFTLDDPSQVKTVDGIRLHSPLTRQQTVGLRSISAQKTQAGYFGNDGDMCDAMDGQSCGELRACDRNEGSVSRILQYHQTRNEIIHVCSMSLIPASRVGGPARSSKTMFVLKASTKAFTSA